MAYTTDRTWVAGEVATAAYFNTYLRDNVKWLSTDKGMCRAYNNAVLPATNSANYTLTLNSERFDNASIHDTGTNTSRLTIPAGHGGKWLFGGSLYFTASAVGNYRSSWISVNGATRIIQVEGPINGTVNTGAGPVSMYSMVATDYAELVVFQDSGGPLNVGGFISTGPEFWGFWVGV